MSGKLDDCECACASSPASDAYSTPTSQLLENVLPENVLKLFKAERNVSHLYDWQLKCLGNQALLGGKNFILSLPTGAGKTLIAEVLMLRELLMRSKNCLLILPFVAIVQEKKIFADLISDVSKSQSVDTGSNGINSVGSGTLYPNTMPHEFENNDIHL